MTKFGIKNLKKYIDLKTDNWEYNKTTNCYAFALGLDIPENKITRRAYYGGYIYQSIVSNPKDIVDLNNQESIELDFKAMGLYYEQIDLHDKIYSSDEWKIAFLILKKAMIFISLEKKNGIWFHKLGRVNPPTCFDDKKILITNPLDVYLDLKVPYIYKHCYRLSKKKF